MIPGKTTNPGGNLILFLGADWWGSDARALAVALRRSGNTLIEVINEDYFPLQWSNFSLKVLRRLAKPLFIQNFNQVVLGHVDNPAIDFVLVFKGMFLKASTLELFRKRGVPIYCFYPDVSFADHGPEIQKCLALYDCVFTTKTFHLVDASLRNRLRNLQLVKHGFDPEVHRTIPLTQRMEKHYGCDVSFIGCWSPKKERLVATILKNIPGCEIKLWGPGWNRASRVVQKCWVGRGAYGDEMAVIYQASKINLGLLSEAAQDTTSGDQTTVRTWQIPASGGFMLHEATAELAQYFASGNEVATFDNADDLSMQVEHYLACPDERARISMAGQQRCITGRYTYAAAAKVICAYYEQRNIC